MKNLYQTAKNSVKKVAMAGLAALTIDACAHPPAEPSPAYVLIYNQSKNNFSPITCISDSSYLIVTTSPDISKIRQSDFYTDTVKGYIDIGRNGKLDGVTSAEESWNDFGNGVPAGKFFPTEIIVDKLKGYNPANYANYLNTRNTPYQQSKVILRNSKEAKKLQKQFDTLRKDCPRKIF